MSKTIVVFGYGPGISTAVAEKFGAEGFQVALVARNAARLEAGVAALAAKGVRAAPFAADLADPAAARAVVGRVRAALGSITVLQWTAYDPGAANLLEADVAATRRVLDIAVTSLSAVVQEALPDLRKATDAGVLVTNGGLGLFDPTMDTWGVGAMGLSVANSAKHKLVALLSNKLAPEKIYVGEVMVLGLVKGTAFDQGGATIAPGAVAQKFWDLYRARGEIYAQVS
ncbi:MAG TPA: SDR family NAD(P)-dependent oxidoreductase [Polyangia bacterium]|jgi:NAD(P)-dependent dehydrogenase (short-subunit alcohol dehydrogenase family)|nr:SDR family NAD(P)-dependent oxidoreductase [Polyangia bacterium]